MSNKEEVSKISLKDRLLNLFRKKERIEGRQTKKSNFVYLYLIFAPMFGLVYFIVSLFFDFLPWHLSLSPLYLAVGYLVLKFIVKNYLALFMYASDIHRGKLMLYLNDNTVWDEAHKLKVVKWVYLGKKKVRSETRMKLVEQVASGRKLKFFEKRRIKFKSVFCPQQVKDGLNEAFLVDALIYAHRKIRPLDNDLRGIMNLTDEHILAFSLSSEIRKCTDEDYAKKVKIGQRAAKKL